MIPVECRWPAWNSGSGRKMPTQVSKFQYPLIYFDHTISIIDDVIITKWSLNDLSLTPKTTNKESFTRYQDNVKQLCTDTVDSATAYDTKLISRQPKRSSVTWRIFTRKLSWQSQFRASLLIIALMLSHWHACSRNDKYVFHLPVNIKKVFLNTLPSTTSCNHGYKYCINGP